jgi:hypothetical protein
MYQPINVSRGEVVGIGKIKIPKTREFNHEIMLLSFLSIKESEDSFISTCIHLRIDGYGKTSDEADKNMVKNVWYFLFRNFKELSIEDAWDNLRDLFKSDDWSSELWDAYREVQVQLSINGVSTDQTAELNFRIDQLEKKRAKDWEIWTNTSENEKKRIKELESRTNELENRIEMINSLFCIADLIVKRMSFKGRI